MGLLSKVGSAVGKIRDKTASAVGALRRSSIAQRVATSAVFKGGAKLAVGGAKFAGKALFGTKVRAALTLGTLGIAAVKKLKGRKQQQDMAIQSAADVTNPQKSGGLGSKILKGAAALAGIGAAGFVAEQVAEKLGVRGGAGFIGRRPRKRKSGTRRKSRGRRTRRTSRRRSSRRRGYGSEGQYRRKGGKDVHYTKSGQPYIILANGRSRFIKRSRR